MFLLCNLHDNSFFYSTGCRFVPWFISVLPEELVLLVIMVLSRPPGLARCLGLGPGGTMMFLVIEMIGI